MSLNPYEPPRTESVKANLDKGTASGMRAARIWILGMVVVWIEVGSLVGKIEIAFQLMLAAPLWVCLAASFFQLRVSRSTIAGGRSLIATSLVATMMWIALCGYIESRSTIPNRGADIGAGMVLTGWVLLAVFIVLPLTAWAFSVRNSDLN